MAVKLSQSLKQAQTLMMTPQLQHAIKLLTLTHMELTKVIAEEMSENPVIEELAGKELADKKADEDYNIEKLELDGKESPIRELQESKLLSKSKSDDFDWQSYADSFNSTSYNPPSTQVIQHDPDDRYNFENMISRGVNLVEHLEAQIREEEFSDEECRFAIQIIRNINDDGYLDLPFDEIISESDISREFAFYVLRRVQSLDPVGCGSQNLTDCLLAQATIMEERSPLLEKIIKNHLKDIECKNFSKIAKDTGVSKGLVEEAIQTLMQFNPRPGRLISPEEILYVVPDIFVLEVGGEFVVRLNDEGVPRLKISQFYQNMLKKIAKGSSEKTENNPNNELKNYVQDKVRSATWLIKSIYNRQNTILKVSEAIVKRQQDFFKKGSAFLKPMVLKDIAEEIEMHESTVSRVTTNKYMHTPIGVFELKYFFSSSIGGKGGAADISSEVLKLKIKNLLENEDPKRPLSDQKIAELLDHEDIKVARRTVAKYRELMGYLSSAKRKIK
jgi:RNA polymerase sigma-54 factor